MIDVRDAWLLGVMAATALTAAAPAAAQAQGGWPAADRFYLRGGFAFDRPSETRFTDVDCADGSAAVLYGCGSSLDGSPLSTLGHFGTLTGYDVGGGYVAARALRLEAMLQHRPNVLFAGRANFLQTAGMQAVAADVSATSVMAAAYLDLAELGLPRIGPFSPFAGGGIGVSRIGIDNMHMEFPRTTTIVPEGQRVNFAWMPAAGVAAALGGRLTLDIAWRYTDFGAIETSRGTASIVWRDGSREPLEIDLAATQAALSSHGLWMSVRYAF